MAKCTGARHEAKNFNKPVYIIFMVAAIAFLIAKDFSQSMLFLGTALLFEPFDTKIPFDKRPFYQRAWLLIHLVATLAILALMVFVK